MTPKQRHREGAVRRWAINGESVCYVADEECSGRLQAAHYIAVQRLRIAQKAVAIRHESGPLTAVAYDELVADDRNSLILCELDHSRFDGFRLSIPPPACVIEFAREYGIERYLPE